MPAETRKPSSSPAAGPLPSAASPFYDESDDHSPAPRLTSSEAEELAQLRADLKAVRAQLDAQQASLPKAPSGGPVGPAGLPAGVYPEREVISEPRRFPKGTDVTEVLEFDRQEDERRALARIKAGLPALQEPLPEGTVTATADEFSAG